MNCPICYEVDNSDAIIETNCKHIFHNNCLSDWLKIDNTCPYCRQNRPLERWYNNISIKMEQKIREIVPLLDIGLITLIIVLQYKHANTEFLYSNYLTLFEYLRITNTIHNCMYIYNCIKYEHIFPQSQHYMFIYNRIKYKNTFSQSQHYMFIRSLMVGLCCLYHILQYFLQ